LNWLLELFGVHVPFSVELVEEETGKVMEIFYDSETAIDELADLEKDPDTKGKYTLKPRI